MSLSKILTNIFNFINDQLQLQLINLKFDFWPTLGLILFVAYFFLYLMTVEMCSLGTPTFEHIHACNHVTGPALISGTNNMDYDGEVDLDRDVSPKK